jgi:hypothetical protein
MKERTGNYANTFFKFFNRAVITLRAMKARVFIIQNVIALPFIECDPL